MPKPDHLIIAAGVLAFGSNFKEAGAFPENGVATIAGTAALATVTAMTRESRIAPAVNAFAVLVLLVAVFVYIPGLVDTKKRKRKNNG